MRKPMLTRLLRACSAVVLSLGLPTSAMASEWIRQLGTEKDDYAYAVATDADGNVYVAGYSGSVTRGNEDAAWLAKLGPGGRVHWKRELRSSGVDIATGVATDADGNIYVVGWTNGSFADGGFISRGLTDAWLAKYDATGSRLWIRQFKGLPGSADYGAQDVTTDRDGNVYVAGNSYGDEAGSIRGWVRKYDPSGNQLGEEFGIVPNPDIATDADGNLYVEGSSGYDEDWHLLKYSAAGDLAWSRWYDMAGENSGYPGGVAADSAGNVYVTGSTRGSFAGPLRGGSDAWLVKWDTTGHELWRRQLGTPKTMGPRESRPTAAERFISRV